ncbi:3-deoxy-D-manno-octulosonic acid transferase [Curvibacter sp. RS43]|uniref:3-deoxy-D-manno-octulosonic acid transferase n=1 Tax=Curvibacter microcysteis TaxID=3026419 RepID=UPI00235FC868|nr:3-deoxy-D-manno-octulosonic acid transferase [Curvibacter sp. RS43]MDD0809842.1 3-deoxy-D-manno-octulosonic acid transferase [Curvibacter sp. RS43]
MSVARALYSTVLRLAQPLLRRKLARRGRTEPGYLTHVEERFGHYSQAPSQGWVWVHAVSLGETRAAGILIEALRAEWARRGWPFHLLLTHGTATGRAEGQRLLREGDVQVWQPWDTPAAVQRFLHQFRPALGLLMETEVWPNLVAACRSQGLPLALANARLNAKSLASAQRLRWLSEPAYQGFRAVWAQTEADAQRLRQLGAPVQAVLGNVKFDARPDPTQHSLGQSLAQRLWVERGQRVLLLASSREGEEALWLQALRQVPPLPGVQWLLVPRHPQRFDAVAALCAEAGLSVARRSQWSSQQPDDLPPVADVWLGDTLGDMALYYSLSRAALLGGSFEPLGGQNLIEAAACACPVLMGPHTFNFADAAALSEASGAAWRVADVPAALTLLAELLAQPERLQAASQAAQGFAAAHRGAAARTAHVAAELLLSQRLHSLAPRRL